VLLLLLLLLLQLLHLLLQVVFFPEEAVACSSTRQPSGYAAPRGDAVAAESDRGRLAAAGRA
jgi:hypothetical protein